MNPWWLRCADSGLGSPVHPLCCCCFSALRLQMRGGAGGDAVFFLQAILRKLADHLHGHRLSSGRGADFPVSAQLFLEFRAIQVFVSGVRMPVGAV